MENIGPLLLRCRAWISEHRPGCKARRHMDMLTGRIVPPNPAGCDCGRDDIVRDIDKEVATLQPKPPQPLAQ